ncbi:MAG TPA: hypothetical protein VKT30_17450 [Caulobacteraceae bacterium]|nr:hypothetical protein [Caulobacteraceae bacterium]
MARSSVISAAAALAALALAAGPALAANGVSVSQESTGLVIDIDSDQAIISLVYVTSGGSSNETPSYEIVAMNGLAPTPVLSLGPCHVNGAGNGIECPAASISTLDFRFKQNGAWHGYNGGGYHASPCAPAGVTIETGPAKLVSINAWDGCAETVICGGAAKGAILLVEADASDEIRGPCTNIIRH